MQIYVIEEKGAKCKLCEMARYSHEVAHWSIFKGTKYT